MEADAPRTRWRGLMNRNAPASLLVFLPAVLLLLVMVLTPVSPALGDAPAGPSEPPSGSQYVLDAAARPMPPADHSIRLQGDDPFCLSFYTGTIRSTFLISNPNGVEGLEGFETYSLANVDQRVLDQSDTTLEIEITVRRYVDTRAQYPVNAKGLPESVQGYLLPDDQWIQSEDPEIAAKAGELVADATSQAEAVEAILAWVRAKIAFDLTSSLPYDALSTFRNRSALCGGFAHLSVALLRAAGIPARTHIGCLCSEGWGVPIQGGWHAWVETYFPDVGWVASEPQTTANFVDTSHIFVGFHQCGQVGTVISRTSHFSGPYADGSGEGFLYSMRTPYVGAPWHGLDVAQVPALDRGFQLRATPDPPGITLPASNPVGSFVLRIEDLSCRSDTDWTISTESSWLRPGVTVGMGSGLVPFSIDASGMRTGLYTGTVMLHNRRSDLDPQSPVAITVSLSLTGTPEGSIHKVYLPAALAG